VILLLKDIIRTEVYNKIMDKRERGEGPDVEIPPIFWKNVSESKLMRLYM